VRGGKPVLLPKWWSPPGPESESAPGPESESEVGSGLQCVYLPLRKFIGFGCRRVAGLTLRLSPSRRWALALRPEHHPGSDQPGHVEQPACRTRCPKEPHAQRSWHLQRSPPVQSEDLPPEVWLPSLSDDERLVEEHARSCGVEEPPWAVAVECPCASARAVPAARPLSARTPRDARTTRGCAGCCSAECAAQAEAMACFKIKQVLGVS